MQSIDLLHDLPWLELGPTEEVMRRIEHHICSERGDFYSVFGPSGCGKTRFMLELSQRLDQYEHLVARPITAGTETIYAQIATILECDADEFEITERLKQVPPTGLKMVLLIDDADRLTNEELAFLHRVKERINKLSPYKSIVLILLMDLNNQDIFSKEILLHSNSYTLPPINLMQVRELLNHLYRFYGKTHNFSAAELKKLHAFSYGYPGRVVRLVELDFAPRKKIGKTKILGGILILILAAILILAYIFRDQLQAQWHNISVKNEVQSEQNSVIPRSPISAHYYDAIIDLIEKEAQKQDFLPQGIIIIQGPSGE